MGALVLCAVIGVGLLAGFTWSAVEDARAARRAAAADEAQAARFEASRDETAVAMARSAERLAAWPQLPKRPGYVPVAPECLDEAEVAQDAVLLIAAATRLCRSAAELGENAALMDEYAERFPMQERPRLVDRAESNPLSGDES